MRLVEMTNLPRPNVGVRISPLLTVSLSPFLEKADPSTHREISRSEFPRGRKHKNQPLPAARNQKVLELLTWKAC